MVIIFFSVDDWTERLDSNQVIEQLALNYIFMRPINHFLNRHVAKRVILEKSQYVLEPNTARWAAGSAIGSPEDISTVTFGDPGKDSNMQPIPYEGSALPVELQGLNPGLKSTNKKVIVEHIARYAGTAPSSSALSYRTLTHLFRLPIHFQRYSCTMQSKGEQGSHHLGTR